MRPRHFTIIFVSLLLSLTATARTISSYEAHGIAADFFSRSGIDASIPFPTEQTQSIAADTRPYYIFNAGNSNGFVIVAGDDRIGSILGYSDSGSFTLENAPDGLVALMELYEQYMDRADDEAADRQIQSVGTPLMQPLLDDIAWGQDSPFNSQTPTYTETGLTSHYYTGCVVTAATQIMKYYNYPQKGCGSKTYTFNGQNLTADFGNTDYIWNDMPGAVPENPSTQQTAAYSTLAYHFGVAVEMQYAKEGSGAYTQLVPAALRDYFGYDPGVRMHPREYYTSEEWMDMIKSELDSRRPVYYGASSDSGLGGHAFVCDGYDSNGYVHINWGWYGRSNGYFMVNHLNPSSLGEGGGTGGYNRSQEVITGIRPSDGDGSPAAALYGAVRLSCVDYSTDFTLMSYVENIGTEDVSGSIGALLVKDGEIVKVLNSESMTVPGFAGGRAGSVQVYMRKISKDASGVADGDGYRIKLGALPTGASDWIILRHPIGLPSYINASVSNGVVIIGESHVPSPDVKLLEKISTDGDVYANGHALFNLKIDNRSTDCRLKNITVRLTSVENPSATVDLQSDVNVYDMSVEELNLLVEMPDNITPGEYDLTAFETSYPDAIFDDSESGRARITVLPASTEPIIRLTGDPYWHNSDGYESVGHGEYLYISAPARNYGAAGKASVVVRLTDKNNPERSYVFIQQTVDVEKGKDINLSFYRKVCVDPGTYLIDLYTLNAAGEESCIEGYPHHAEVIVGNSLAADIEVVSLDIPSQLDKAIRGSYTLKLRALKDFSGTIYLRIRQFTNTSGEIVYMKSGVRLTAGEETSLNFNYRPGVDVGTYMMIVESRPLGVSTGGEIPAMGIDAYYREIKVSDLSGIDNVGVDAQQSVTISRTGDMLGVSYADDTVCGLYVIGLDGRILAAADSDSVCIGGIPEGIYLLRVRTATKLLTVKFKK